MPSFEYVGSPLDVGLVGIVGGESPAKEPRATELPRRALCQPREDLVHSVESLVALTAAGRVVRRAEVADTPVGEDLNRDAEELGEVAAGQRSPDRGAAVEGVIAELFRTFQQSFSEVLHSR
jgi:hypothetical protein